VFIYMKYIQPNFTIATLFSGAGGLDLGFKQAGFDLLYANEFDKTIWETHHANFPEVYLDKRSILEVNSKDIPDVDGFIGGPPCQSWSEAGSKKGIEDKRGKLFFDYIRLIKEKKPKFFLAENVKGILHKRNETAFQNILKTFEDAGYKISYKLLNTIDFNVPQDRKRVLIIGFRSDLNKIFVFPDPLEKKLTLRDAIWDLKNIKPEGIENNNAIKIERLSR